MKAIQVVHYGGPEALLVQNVEIGKPGPGQAVVKMAFAGVNFVDIYHRNGSFPHKGSFPFTLGFEGSGVVEEIGPHVTDVKVGDRVAFTGMPRSYAEKVLILAERLIPLPDDFSFEEGAAFPLQGMTAHYLIHNFYHIKHQDVVLIHAAAGGVGLLLVQWARKMGANVFGTVSTEEKAKIALEAGCHETILYTKNDFVREVKRLTNNHGADYILDGVGKTTFGKGFEAAATRGHLVLFGFASGPPENVEFGYLMLKSLTLSSGSLHNFIITRQELLIRAEAVIQAIREKWLKLKIDRILPLEEASVAHKLLENRETSGKILLKI